MAGLTRRLALLHQNQYKKMLNRKIKCGNIDGCMNKFMEEALKDFPVVKVSEKSAKFLYNGGKIQERFFTEKPASYKEGDIVVAYDHENNLVGLYEIIKDDTSFLIKPHKMLIKE